MKRNPQELDPNSARSRSVLLHGRWTELGNIRKEVQRQFEGCGDELRDAAIMAATELAENVLKHGDLGSGVVVIARQNGEAVISTQNRVSAVKATTVRDQILSIASGDPRELFVARMLELLGQPDDGRSGLGLVRIAYEGGFRLSCEVLGDRLHIQARRPIEHALSN